MKGEYISIETSKIMADIEKENKELHDRIEKVIDYIKKINNKKIIDLNWELEELLCILKGE